MCIRDSIESGRIVKAVQRSGSTMKTIDKHPETGKEFTEMVFPDWDQMCEVTRTASENLPNCFFQGWDVAMTDNGPVILELEADGGSPILGQLCFDSGVLDERYKHALEYAVRLQKKERDYNAQDKKAQVKNSFSAISNFRAAQERMRESNEPSDSEQAV